RASWRRRRRSPAPRAARASRATTSTASGGPASPVAIIPAGLWSELCVSASPGPPQRSGPGDACWRSCRVRRPVDEGRKLASERLDRTAAPALGQRLRHGVREDLLLVVLHAVEDGAGDGLR